MFNEPIQFKKQRELGSILSDTFTFIRQNWKPLFRLILKIAGPALVILLAAYVYYMMTTLNSLDGIFSGMESNIENFTTNTFIAIFIMLFAAVVFYSLLNGTILHYIKSYIKNGGTVINEEVNAGVKANFWSLIGLSFMVSIMVFFGFIFCIAPGFYLGVVLATSYSILVFENKGAMDAIQYSFDLIKGEWWNTFATLLVVILLYYFVAFIFQVPQYIYFFIKAITSNEEFSADPATMFDGVYVALTTIGMVFQYLLYSIIVVATAFVYFNLNEKKNFTGTMETIDEIGSGR